MRPPLRPVAFAAACLLLVSSCSSDDGDGQSGGSPQEQAPWPFTGLPGYTAEAAPTAVTVKIENTEAGRPQLGLDAADVVVQELVEGGLTRLAVIFHSDYPTTAGPVRSMRETDIGIVEPTGGPLVASGGAPATVAAIESAGVTVVTGDGPGFSRDPNRRVPYELMLDVQTLVADLPPSPPPGPYFDFAPVPQGAVGTAASALDLRWPSARSSFAYDPETETWGRTDVADATGLDFTNVVAISLPVTFASDTDAAGSPIPIMATTGTGTGVVATGGSVYDIAWSKASLAEPWEFTFLPAGEGAVAEPFPLQPGRTWLALLPQQGGTATVTPAQPPSGASSEG